MLPPVTTLLRGANYLHFPLVNQPKADENVITFHQSIEILNLQLCDQNDALFSVHSSQIAPNKICYTQDKVSPYQKCGIRQEFEITPQIQNTNTTIIRKHHSFSPEEDSLLKHYIEQFGKKNWHIISMCMGNRTPRECKDRWNSFCSNIFLSFCMDLITSQIRPSVLITWSDYYDSPFIESPTLQNETFTQENKSFTLNDKYVWVRNCFFSRIAHEGSGGGIFYDQVDAKFLIEYSSFSQCSISGSHCKGACIFIDKPDSVISHTFCNNCSSVNMASFAAVIGNSKNDLHELSISNCKSNTYATANELGFIDVTNINISYNTASFFSGPAFQPTILNSTIDAGVLVRFSTYIENNSTQTGCFAFVYGGSGMDVVNKIIVENSNFVNNKGPGTFYISGYGKLSHVCFMMNDDPLFFLDTNSKIELFDCSSDSLNQTGSGTIIQSSSLTPSICHIFISTEESNVYTVLPCEYFLSPCFIDLYRLFHYFSILFVLSKN